MRVYKVIDNASGLFNALERNGDWKDSQIAERTRVGKISCAGLRLGDEELWAMYILLVLKLAIKSSMMIAVWQQYD